MSLKSDIQACCWEFKHGSHQKEHPNDWASRILVLIENHVDKYGPPPVSFANWTEMEGGKDESCRRCDDREI